MVGTPVIVVVVGSWVLPLFAIVLLFLVLKEKLTVFDSKSFFCFFIHSDLTVKHHCFKWLDEDIKSKGLTPKILCELPDNYVNDIRQPLNSLNMKRNTTTEAVKVASLIIAFIINETAALFFSGHRFNPFVRYSGEVDQAIPWQTDQPISWRRGTKNAVVAFSKLNN